MTHIKCSQCGLNNWHGAQVCERCGVSLDQREAHPVTTPLARPDFPVLYTLGGNRPPRSKTWMVILAVIIMFAVGGGAWAVYRSSRGKDATRKRTQLVERTFDERTRDALLSCLAQPGFVGTKISEQVLGPIRLEMLQVSDREVYFSAPASEKLTEALESIVARFIIDSKRIDIAEDDGAGRLRLGNYSLSRSAHKDLFFKTPIDNIKFDTGTVLKFPFKQATYTLDMRELQDFLQNKSIFGGRMNARMEQTRAGRPVIFANHGALVANPQETSLRRFVNELTRDIQPNTEGAREARVQRVLDFVSREIRYDMRATTYNYELLNRPNEVLMSGESDCSNKAILLGSLLEQLGEDYLFVYTPDHITVAVKQGSFPVRNNLYLAWQREVWLIAEGTAPGFRIGIDRVQDEGRFKQFQHLQRPRDRDVIFDWATGRQLSFQ